MARTGLEINIFDEILVVDSLKKAIVVVLEAFKKWYESDSEIPFSLSIKRIKNKAPPALEINVKEEVITKTAFG